YIRPPAGRRLAPAVTLGADGGQLGSCGRKPLERLTGIRAERVPALTQLGRFALGLLGAGARIGKLLLVALAEHLDLEAQLLDGLAQRRGVLPLGGERALETLDRGIALVGCVALLRR